MSALGHFNADTAPLWQCSAGGMEFGSALKSFRSCAQVREVQIGLEFSVTVPSDVANGLATDLRQILQELGLAEAVKVEYEQNPRYRRQARDYYVLTDKRSWAAVFV